MTESTPGTSELQNLLAGWESASSDGTFEEAMSALEAIVRLLDQGNLALDDSIRSFEIGTRLSERCQQLLESAELRISALSPTPEYDDDVDPDPWTTGAE